jgi:hypothetical protein
VIVVSIRPGTRPDVRLRSGSVTASDLRFTCPVCGAKSSHPGDTENGYCVGCHAFTGDLRNPLPAEQPLVLWFGSTVATIGVVGPCSDPRPHLVEVLRKVADQLECALGEEQDEDQADEGLEPASDRPLVDEPPTWPPDHP